MGQIAWQADKGQMPLVNGTGVTGIDLLIQCLVIKYKCKTANCPEVLPKLRHFPRVYCTKQYVSMSY